MRAWVLVAGLTGALPSIAASPQSRPLPDPEPFYAATRANVARAQAAQNRFAYRERRTELHLNPFGRLGSGGILVYDVTPIADGSVERRLVERDGRAVTDAPVDRRPPRTPPAADRRSNVDDVVSVLRFSIRHREVRDGRDVVAVGFEPKPGAEPATRQGELARHFKGTIFVDEAAHEVMRVEATAIEDLTYGMGLVARLEKGTTVTVSRQRIEPDLWMPTSIRFIGHGRALLLRPFEIDQVIEWSDYRRVVR
jgi:hypothetical protein